MRIRNLFITILFLMCSGNLLADKKLDEKSSKEELLEKIRRLEEENQRLKGGPGLKDFSDDFFQMEERDPFGNLEKMDEVFDRMRKQFHHLFKQYPFGINEGEVFLKITPRSDKKNIYYDIETKNIDQKNLNIKVENGMINVSGEYKVEKKSIPEKGGSQYFSQSKSSFSRSFPLPKNANAEKMKVSQKGNIVTIQLPKIEEGEEPKIIKEGDFEKII